MQKFYRFSAAILIVSLVLLTAPPAQAVHVIAAGLGPGGLFSVTNTGEVYHTVNNGTTWTLIGTVPGAFGFFVDGALGFTLLSVQGTALFFSLVSVGSVGTAIAFAPNCSGSPIRSFVISDFGPASDVAIVHEDGTICFNGSPITGPPEEPVAVEETTWGAVKDTYKFKD